VIPFILIYAREQEIIPNFEIETLHDGFFSYKWCLLKLHKARGLIMIAEGVLLKYKNI
jgi:hypothetical protein